MNKIQFQKGMSLNQFLARYGVEQQCEAALEDARWPEGFWCPKCGTKDHYQYRRGNVKIFQCRGCRTQTTLTEGTIFHSTKLPLTSGSENKIPFIAAVQTNSQNNPIYAVFSQIKAFTSEEVIAWANRSLVPDATMIVSDGFDCFRAVSETIFLVPSSFA